MNKEPEAAEDTEPECRVASLSGVAAGASDSSNEFSNYGAHNKSLDVRAKQRLSYRSCLFNSELREFGFAPRQFNRSVFFLTYESVSVRREIL